MTVVGLLLFAFVLWIAGVALLRITKAWEDDPSLDRSLGEDEVLHEVRELLHRKTMLMQLIQSMENDVDMARIDAKDAAPQIRRYKRETVRVMKRLDELQGEPQDIEKATELFEARAIEAAARIEQGEQGWSSVAIQRHGGNLPAQEGGKP